MKEERRILLPSRRRFLRTGLICGTGLIAAQFVQPKCVLASGGSWNGQVSASTDDAWQSGGGGGVVQLTDSTNIYRGSNGDYMGFRFQDVVIPQGVTITSAILQIFCAASQSSSHTDVCCDVHAELIDTSPTFTTALNDISDRTLTTNYVTWDIWDGTNPSWMSGPDISSVITEVVGQSGWNSGNNLSIIWYPDSPGDPGCLVEMYDGIPSKAAKLAVTW